MIISSTAFFAVFDSIYKVLVTFRITITKIGSRTWIIKIIVLSRRILLLICCNPRDLILQIGHTIFQTVLLDSFFDFVALIWLSHHGHLNHIGLNLFRIKLMCFHLHLLSVLLFDKNTLLLKK